MDKIVILVDRSGSMHPYALEYSQHINGLIKKYQAEADDVALSIYNFNTEVQSVIEDKVLVKDKNYDYVLAAEGGTALYDSACTVIDTVGKELNSMSDDAKPKKVIFYIITDGEENSSREYGSKDLKDRIEHQESKYSWDFVYLGANQDAIKNGSSVGVKSAKTSGYAMDKGAMMFDAVYASSLRSRTGGSADLTDEEKQNMV